MMENKDSKNNMIIESNWGKIEASVHEEFPEILYGFGYGSGVIPQTGYDYSEEMPLIDLIFVVQNQREWHRQNFRRNRQHYTGIPYFLGSSYVNLVNNLIFPVSFFPDVQLKTGLMVKYGVVNLETMVDDLNNWNLMTVAGRMQKPIRVLEIENMDFYDEIEEARKRNLKMAYHYSKRNLESDQFSEISFDDILREIVSLSYKGDIRMDLKAESGNKVQKIYEGNNELLRKMYSNIAESEEEIKLCNVRSDYQLRKINRKSSYRMALSQVFLGSLTKNV